MENTFTEEQLAEINKQIADAVNKAVDETTAKLTKDHNDAMAGLRKKAKADQEEAVKNAVDKATLSTEELAKKQVEEQMKAKDTELAELRAYKKQGELQKKLANAGVPTMFVHDSRLLNAEEGKIDEVIETIKTEYSKTLPQGATTSTNVSTNGASSSNDAKAKKFEEFSKMR